MEKLYLQKSIVQKVLNMDDPHLLNSLYMLLNNNDNKETYQLSDIEKPVLSENRYGNLHGETIPNDILFYQNVNWISE